MPFADLASNFRLFSKLESVSANTAVDRTAALGNLNRLRMFQIATVGGVFEPDFRSSSMA